MDTYFAPAERAGADELEKDLNVVSKNPVIDGIMRAVNGILAVLNKHRQVVAVNDSLLKMIGIESAGKILGFRPGEVMQCVHAQEEPGGCGTSKYCSTCGAAIAITTSLAEDRTIERKCAILTTESGIDKDLALLVQCSPIIIERDRYLLLFLRDLTDYEKWASLEKIFYHDINNLIHGLNGACTLLDPKGDVASSELIQMIKQLSARLANEVAIQRTLLDAKHHDYQVSTQNIPVKLVIKELNDTLANHPVVKGRKLTVSESLPDTSFNSDLTVLLRILTNMLINAFEASDEGDEVKLIITPDNENITFQVWNRKDISDEFARRIFQRYFTTKEGSGRGLGTYSLKILGEEILKGKVGFTSSQESGTIFSLELPQ